MNPEIINRVVDMAIQLQQIPAPTFNEKQKAEFIRSCFAAEKLRDIEIDETGNVYGRLPGKGFARPIIVSAHLDTVFPLETDLHLQRSPEKVYGPGIGDNSVGTAGLLGLLWCLDKRQAELESDLWLVANVGEEGLGNLRGIQEIVTRFADQPRAYIVLEGMALGQVYHRGLGVERYQISVETAGGHSWVDYGKPSAVHEIAAIAARLSELTTSEVPRTTFNVGMIAGGTSINTIAAEANIKIDLRSEDVTALGQLNSAVNSILQEYQKPGVKVVSEMIGQRPAGGIPPGHPLVEIACRSLEQVGIKPRLNIGSTDANLPLSRGYPAVCIGLTTGNGAHTTAEYINIAPLKLGLEQLVLVVEALDRSELI